MAEPRRGNLPGDLHITGRLSADEISYPAESIGDAEIADDAAIDPSKVVQQYVKELKINGAVAARTEPIHVAVGAGELVGVDAGQITLNTVDATTTINVLKNGVTVLSAPLVLDSGDTIRELVAAGIDPAAADYVVDDWFDVTVAVAAGAGALGTGLIVRLIFREAPG
jgi:hypothetical protein